ncbi:hypothetical protein HID58_027404 [Brassica napus]|uniref:Glycolipid transfer protein domain-containing protein n=1 Tax=Brassica napus TaxID=3708 RepID=A0ABQ8CRT5_BRANA|nr:hypothetical protein HID58_027404 [Brassica napus]
MFQEEEVFKVFATVSAKLYNKEEYTKDKSNMEKDMIEDARFNTPLLVITEAFEDLADLLKPRRQKRGEIGRNGVVSNDGLRLDAFCSACTHVSVLFGCLGFAFKFAEMELEIWWKRQKRLIRSGLDTLHNIIDLDVMNQTVKTQGSYSRNLRRVRLGLDLIRAIFEQFLMTNEYYSLKDAATKAYTQVCAPFHTWAVRTAVYAGMYTLPTRDQLLLRLNETDQSVEKNMRRYMEASRPIIEYIDKLYIDRNIKLDW